MIDQFPKINYNGILISDITRRIVIDNEIKSNIAYLNDYVIKDGENVEDIAFNFYGSCEYNLLILLLNNINDPFYGWVLSLNEFEKYINDKYGSENLNNIHHYEKKGRIVSANFPYNTAVTNREYETLINDKKRHIKLLKPQYLIDFISEFNDQITEG